MSAISKLHVRNVPFVLLNCCSSSAVFVSVSMIILVKRNKSVASVISFGNNWQEKQFSQLLIFLMVCLFY